MSDWAMSGTRERFTYVCYDESGLIVETVTTNSVEDLVFDTVEDIRESESDPSTAGIPPPGGKLLVPVDFVPCGEWIEWDEDGNPYLCTPPPPIDPYAGQAARSARDTQRVSLPDPDLPELP